MSDQHYVDENGNPIDPSELADFEPVTPGPAARPATVATKPAPAPRGGGSGIRVAVAVAATAALMVGAGYAGIKAGWIDTSASPAAPSASAAPTTATPSSAAASTSSAASPSTSESASTSTNSAPVAVDNSRYTSAKWPLTAVKKPSVRLRVTNSLKLPSSAGMWDANVAKAFDRFAPWVTIAATGPNQITVQTIPRAEVTKSWAESVVDVSGAPRVTSENSGSNVDDSRELTDVDGSPAADTGPDDDKPVSYYVEGGEIPTAAKGKRAGMVSVSVVKRDGKGKSVVWFVAGGTLCRAVVEDMSGGGSAGQDEGK